jgi:hypothetical protein
MAAGVVATFEHDQEGIARYRDMYRSRLERLIELLTRQGMQLALEPAAGFFTLWKIPTRAFGQQVENRTRHRDRSGLSEGSGLLWITAASCRVNIGRV